LCNNFTPDFYSEFCDRLINSPQIKLANGLTILGKIDAEFPDLVYAFDTVPYGLPPTEDLRFSKPRNMPNVTAYDSHLLWNGTGSYRSCIQPKKLDSQFSEQTESCLFVNIYTPMEFTSDSNFPVLVDFHGGGFIAGSNTLNSGSHLAAV
jgi:carboxylesterase type B